MSTWHLWRAQGLSVVDADAPDLLTRADGETYELHALHVAHAPGAAGRRAQIVNLADLDDHLAQPWARGDRPIRGRAATSAVPRRPAIDRRCRELRQHRAHQRPRNDVARIVDAGVHPRVADERGQGVQRDAGGGQSVRDAEVALLALPLAVRPTSLAAVYAMLSREAPRRLMVAYTIAGLAFTIAIGLAVVGAALVLRGLLAL